MPRALHADHHVLELFSQKRHLKGLFALHGFFERGEGDSWLFRDVLVVDLEQRVAVLESYF